MMLNCFVLLHLLDDENGILQSCSPIKMNETVIVQDLLCVQAITIAGTKLQADARSAGGVKSCVVMSLLVTRQLISSVALGRCPRKHWQVRYIHTASLVRR